MPEKQTRWRMRLEDFGKALGRLNESLDRQKFSELEKDGCIQRFEFTFELAWKTMKDYLEDQGFKDVASPKKAIRKAFQDGVIRDGDLWVEMIDDRNRLSHLYEQETSELIFANIRDKYASALNRLFKKLR